MQKVLQKKAKTTEEIMRIGRAEIVRSKIHNMPFPKLLDQWVPLEKFKQEMRQFRDSKVRCVEWLQKYTLIDPFDEMKLTECQAIIRTFIEKEILAE